MNRLRLGIGVVAVVLSASIAHIASAGLSPSPYLITPDGRVTLNGRPGADEACTLAEIDPEADRELSVTWRGPAPGYSGPPLPLHISLTGSGGNYAGPYLFGYWPLLDPIWNWYDPSSALIQSDHLDGAFNLVIRFECMNSSHFNDVLYGADPVARQAYLADIAFNPLDINYVYELLCTDAYPDSPDRALLAGINRAVIDCSRVGLSGNSGGGFTSIMFLNECFENLSVTPHIRAIGTRIAGFFPLALCPADGTRGFSYRFDRSVPLFMKVACSDTLVPFDQMVAQQWQSAPVPKYLYSRTGFHPDAGIETLLVGEDLLKAFMRSYLLGDTGPDGRDALDDYPDRVALRVSNDPGPTSYQYQSEVGTVLTGGLCRSEFEPWTDTVSVDSPVGRDYWEYLTQRVEDEATLLPETK